MQAQRSARIGITELEKRWEKLLCLSNCKGRALPVKEETWEQLWSFDLEVIPEFISAYTNTLQMVRWLTVYEPEMAFPFGEEAFNDLEETLRHARAKLNFQATKDDIPDSYERATSECIRRMEDISEKLSSVLSKVESGGRGLNKGEIRELLGSFHQHMVNPPGWMDYESS